MRGLWTAIIMGLAVSASVPVAVAQSTAGGIAASPLAAPAAHAKGYLNTATLPDALRILPPPPPPGSGREADDRAVFTATRALAGASRWALATQDADQHPAAVLAAFSCALGVSLDARNAPTLMSLARRLSVDAHDIVDAPKDHYQRRRPYLDAAGDAPICVDKTDALAQTPSYPSGHATAGWAMGLILAELAPDRATDILMRARAFGESRIVCGVHYLSDVEAGRTTGAALVAALHGDADFRADLDKARGEVAAARHAIHAAPGACHVADAAGATPPY